MKFKKLISFMVILTIMISTCCISAFAALDYTETYYMNGYKNYGSTVMVDTLSSSTTYSENIGYGKAAQMRYFYYYNHNLLYLDRGSVSTFVTNGFDGYSVSYTYTTSTDEYFGAIGKHLVKASSYMIWSSYDCEDDSCVGSVNPDYSDI